MTPYTYFIVLFFLSFIHPGVVFFFLIQPTLYNVKHDTEKMKPLS